MPFSYECIHPWSFGASTLGSGLRHLWCPFVVFQWPWSWPLSLSCSDRPMAALRHHATDYQFLSSVWLRHCQEKQQQQQQQQKLSLLCDYFMRRLVQSCSCLDWLPSSRSSLAFLLAFTPYRIGLTACPNGQWPLLHSLCSVVALN